MFYVLKLLQLNTNSAFSIEALNHIKLQNKTQTFVEHLIC